MMADVRPHSYFTHLLLSQSASCESARGGFVPFPCIHSHHKEKKGSVVSPITARGCRGGGCVGDLLPHQGGLEHIRGGCASVDTLISSILYFLFLNRHAVQHYRPVVNVWIHFCGYI